MDSEIVTRASLGKGASLGQLYDINTDNFCEQMILKKDYFQKFLKTKVNNTSSLQILETSPSSYCQRLSVDIDHQLSLICNLFLQNSLAIFLYEQLTTDCQHRICIHNRIVTKEEDLDLKSKNVLEVFASPTSTLNATHVVVGITWGGNTILMCDDENKEPVADDEKWTSDYERALLKEDSQARKSLMNEIYEAVLGFGEYSGNKKKTLSLSVYSDIGDLVKEPINVTDAIHILKEHTSSILKCNDGKGVPIKYRLLPLKSIQTYKDIPMIAQNHFSPISVSTFEGILNVLNEADTLQNYIFEILEYLNFYNDIISEDDLKPITRISDHFNVEKDTFISKLKSTLVLARSGRISYEILDSLCGAFMNGEVNPTRESSELRSYNSLREKIELSFEVTRHQGIFAGHQTNLLDELEKYKEYNWVILFFKNISCEDATWKNNWELFLNLMQQHKEQFRYFAVDSDSINHSHLPPAKTSSCIQVLINGKIVQHDLLADLGKEKKTPMVITNASAANEKPLQTTLFRIPCPGRSCNQSKSYQWTCKSCSSSLLWGFNNFVYCDCGKTNVEQLLFKCIDPIHGLFFEKHDPGKLKTCIQDLSPKEEINILILGETGVGKSTWINGFLSFANFATLDEAEKHDLISLIPTSFTVTDEDFNEVTVRTGEDENESFDDGQSSTQESKIYSFSMGKTTIRLIDTPGIGDTRGVEQDEKNFENILDTVGQVPVLHGICVLLKPNQAKVNVMFRFCIKELLTHLHKDASKNIVFCFTNSRGTFYKPGDTRRSLMALLGEMKDVKIPFQKDTVYCYDSEAYRFLAAIKNNPPVNFPPDEKENFSKSWEKSIQETSRMLTYFKSLEPHPIKSTLNLNHARQMILKLTRPLAEIMRNIQDNKEQLEKEYNKISQTDENIEDLKRNLNVTRITIETRSLDYPRTVCGGKGCVKYVEDGGKYYSDYAQVCHERCSRNGVKREGVGSSMLKKCKVFSLLGNCKVCNHSYKKHLQIYYESKQVPTVIEDPVMRYALDKNLNAREMKERILQEKQRVIYEYTQEQAAIQEASARFAYFLKTNAITPFNDGMEEYLNHLIKEEANKVHVGGRSDSLDALEKTKMSYLKDRMVLEDELGKAEVMFSPKIIENMVNDLKKLQHSGQNLNKALECRAAAEQMELQSNIVEISFKMKISQQNGGGAFKNLF